MISGKYSPHRDSKGNPVVQAVGVSIMDEMTNYHTGCIIRTGGKNLGSVTGPEFKQALHKHWLRVFPQPKFIRFDTEGAFRDVSLVEWLESQDVRVQYAAGEAPWQVGRHSRHLATLKDTMSVLALSQSPDLEPDELLSLALGAKNRLHQIQGYSPNQWAFGSERNSVESWLEKGDHLPTQSSRHQSVTLEQNLQRIQSAKEAFLRADGQRRILRAEKGKARRAEEFEVGPACLFLQKRKRWC